jgi:acyl-coenzyme A synthetase/AMP-(fatty) acid ligase
VPRRWEFVDAMPLNASGKIPKRELRESLAPPAADS